MLCINVHVYILVLCRADRTNTCIADFQVRFAVEYTSQPDVFRKKRVVLLVL